MGFGFVTMSTVEEVEAATRQFNGYLTSMIGNLELHELDGRQLRVVNFGPPPSKGDSFSRGQRDGGRGGYSSVGGGGGRSHDNKNKVYVDFFYSFIFFSLSCPNPS
ncbi:putative nucleotide-binding alpha-beta plait domain superfamily, RNA-binding domain superfamily [Helianthus anomalus]